MPHPLHENRLKNDEVIEKVVGNLTATYSVAGSHAAWGVYRMYAKCSYKYDESA